ncbi:MAG: porin family protein [Tannerella sp.]|jgi:hypothetical protein|nr:porin family protein [Tannerella sp.]
MKKFFILCVIVCACASVKAQLYVGGALSFWVSENGDVETTTVKFLPEVGYAISDKWAVGGVLGYTHTEVDDYDATKTYKFAPYARFSFYRTDLVRLFVDGGFSVYSSKVGKGDTNTTFSTGFEPGVALNLSKRVSLVTKFGFFGYREYSDDHDAFGLNLDGNTLTFGVYYSF